MTAPADAHVVVVGGGPAGLTAATELKRRGVGRVTVIDRELQLGGIPRHTDHLGFGLRDLHRVMRGPRYAALLVAQAERLRVAMRAGSTVIDIDRTSVVLATGQRVDADALVLATGVRERPRSARLVPGDRPAGVFTTGSIQQLTALHHRSIGRRAVIVGAEHVSFSAIWTLRHGGCEPVAMVTPFSRHQTVTALRLATATRYRIPIISGATVVDIAGRHRVEAVTLSDGRRLMCDTVVFTGDWIPDHEVARRADLVMTPTAKSPATTSDHQTSSPGVFAIGNLVHPAETADICALDGRAVASPVLRWLTTGNWPDEVTPITVDRPVAWAAHSSHGVTARVDSIVRGRLQLVDGERVVASTRRRVLVPNRAIVMRGGDASTALAVRFVER
ncbi:MAG: oxidoreductase [Ilumatobacteraceae bacterium]|nr:oxidoreductase [Ilumatobacteraceae bacterium]